MKLPPHFEFTRKPTPILKTERAVNDIRSYRLWIKRDDLTGVELSGNKVRKLDFLMKEAVEQGAGRIITCGGVQSNHCRATAYVAAKLGLKTTLVLKGNPPETATGNWMLNRLLGVDMYYITEEEYRDVDTIMANIAGESDEQCYVIPEGGSNEVGAWGYVSAFHEIIKQIGQQGPAIDTIVTATGSGGTHAGLLIARCLTQSPLQILSVNVCDDAAFFSNKIDDILRRFKKRFAETLTWRREDIHIVDGYAGQGYGALDSRLIQTITKIAQTEGIVLDPVYGAKAWTGMIDQMKKGNIPGQNILFIHTGGVFGLFPYGNQIFA